MEKKINVLLSGLPGKMTSLLVKTIKDEDEFNLCSDGLCGPKLVEDDSWLVKNLSRPFCHEEILAGKKSNSLIVVDYSTPDRVNRNAELFCKVGTPFVMGTTSGDRDALVDTVKSSNISAVIAPNMSAPIVGFMSMMEFLSKSFPDLFKDFTLEVIESHQEGKKGVSGTARDIVEKYFPKLGINFSTDKIVMVRKAGIQKNLLNIPDEYFSGHSYHTYSLKSSDGTVMLEFKHNVLGRQTYIDGTIKAIKFLHKKVLEGSKGEVFTMMDVCKER